MVSRRIAGEMLLVPVHSGVADREAIYTLNQVAATLWELVEQGADLEEMTAVLCDCYAVAPETARRDAADFLAELIDEGLARLAASEGM
jgi:hypothetical protein